MNIRVRVAICSTTTNLSTKVILMADCTNQYQSSIGDWTGLQWTDLQHHFRYAIMFNIISTWENLEIEQLI